MKLLLEDIWFTLYPRSKNYSNPIDSSDFEHVFLGEAKKKSREVGGMHNWIHVYMLEKEGNFNYTGYINSYAELLPVRYAFYPSSHMPLIRITLYFRGGSCWQRNSRRSTITGKTHSDRFSLVIAFLCPQFNDVLETNMGIFL